MANPNLVEQTARYDITLSVAATTSAVDILTNTAASGEIYRITGVYACNNSTNVPTVTVGRKASATDFPIVKDIPLPVASSLVPIMDNAVINLMEGDSLTLIASAAEVDVHVTYSVIS